MLEWVDNHFLVIEPDQNYTSSVVSVLFHKTGGGEGRLFEEKRLFSILSDTEKGRLFEGGTNSRIYGIWKGKGICHLVIVKGPG